MISTPTDVPPALRECLAAFEAYRRLGYQADDIFMIRGANGLFMQLKEGAKEFIVAGGMWRGTDDQLMKLWTECCAAWNGGFNEAQKQEIWEASFVRQNSVALVAAMKVKGFDIGRRDLN